MPDELDQQSTMMRGGHQRTGRAHAIVAGYSGGHGGMRSLLGSWTTSIPYRTARRGSSANFWLMILAPL